MSAQVEIVYTWPNGETEVRYRAPENSHHAMNLINEVLELQKKDGPDCPYSWRVAPASDDIQISTNARM